MMQVGKLLKYLSGLSTITSDEPPVAKAEQLSNTSGITAYFQKLIGPEVTLNRLYYLSNVVVLISSIITTLHLTTNPVVKSTTIPLMECSITAAMVKSTAGLPTKEKKKKTRKTKKTDCTAVVSTTPVVEHSINGGGLHHQPGGEVLYHSIDGVLHHRGSAKEEEEQWSVSAVI